MLADFLAPLWDFLFDKFGVFGIVIAVSSPIICLGIIVVLFFLTVGVCGAIHGKHLKNILRKAENCERSDDLEAAWKYRLKYLKKVKSDPQEEYRMGMLCLAGRETDWSLSGTQANPITWLKRAANAKQPDARLELAKIQYRDHVEKQPLESARAVNEIRLLAEEGFEPAKAFMKNQEQQWQTRLKTIGYGGDIQCAVMGHAHSQRLVGTKLYQTNSKEALQWYLLAAEGGDPDAQMFCAEFHRRGEGGFAKDEKKVFFWCKKAAEQGLKEAVYLVGCMYAAGMGCTKDYDLAIQWLEKAAALGNVTAEYNLSLCYEELARECAEKNGLKTRLDRLHNKQYMFYMLESSRWADRAKEHGYQET